MFIFTFFCVVVLKGVFAHSPIKYEQFLNEYLRPIYMESYRVQLPRANVVLRVMTMKMYSTFSVSLEVEPHHQMQFSILSRISLLFFVAGS